MGVVADLRAAEEERSRSSRADGRRARGAMAGGRAGARRSARSRSAPKAAPNSRRRSRRRSSPIGCTARARGPTSRAKMFQSGSNVWKTYAAWPPAGAKPTDLYLHDDGSLSFTAPAAGEGCRDYVSDPANPVPFRKRPMSRTYATPDWRLWETDDQRFVDHRPDVLSYVSAPLDHDVTVTGEIAAKLMASTSGTDSDFVVKLIDVLPADYVDTERDELGARRLCQDAQRLSVADRDGGAARAFPGERHQPAAAGARQGDRVGRAAARPRPCVQEGPPHHGPDPVELVPGDRPQPAELRRQHHARQAERLRQGDAAGVFGVEDRRCR